MLTAAEQDLLRRVFMFGPAALAEANYAEVEASKFLTRPDVRAAWTALLHEHDHQDVVFGTTRFVLRRQLSRLGEAATSVLAQALAGPEYAHDTKGHVLIDAKGRPILATAEPTLTQVVAARDVLDRLDAGGQAKLQEAKVNVNVLFEKDRAERVALAFDAKLVSEEERALSRERVRNVVELLRAKLPKPGKSGAPPGTPPAAKPRPTRRAVRRPAKSAKAPA